MVKDYESKYLDIEPVAGIDRGQLFDLDLPESIPKLPCRIGMIGSSHTGKSTVAYNLITKYWLKNARSIFDVIIVMTPTLEQDAVFQSLRNNPTVSNVIELFSELDYDLLD